jgi:hypothetical protein
MNKISIIPHDIIAKVNLPEMSVDSVPTEGDPIEINGELYFVCEKNYEPVGKIQKVGVIPLVVRNPKNVKDIQNYMQCLSLAHRKVQFRNDKGVCDLENCSEMIIT